MHYIFYRVYIYYKKKEQIPIMMGIYFIFVIQLSLFFLLGVIFNFITDGVLTANHLSKTLFLTICTIIFLSLFVADIFQFGTQKRVKKISDRFENSTLNKKIKTWQIFVLPIFVILLSVCIIILFR